MAKKEVKSTESNQVDSAENSENKEAQVVKKYRVKVLFSNGAWVLPVGDVQTEIAEHYKKNHPKKFEQYFEEITE